MHCNFNHVYQQILLELSLGKDVLNRFIHHFFYYDPEQDVDQREEMLQSARDYINEFLPLMKQNKTKYKDIFQYEDEGDLSLDISNAQQTSSKRELRKANKQGAKLVFSNQFVDVRLITTSEAAIIYGKGTRWCVSSTEVKSHMHQPIGKMYFDLYAAEGNLYYFLCKPGAEQIKVDIVTAESKPRFIRKNDKFAAVIGAYSIKAYSADNVKINSHSFLELADALKIPRYVLKGK